MKARVDTSRSVGARTLDKGEALTLAGRFLMGFLLARVRIFDGIAPFGAAFIGASRGGVNGILSFLGVILGTLTAGSFSWAVKYIAIAAVVWSCIHFFVKAAPKWFPMAAVFGASLVIGAVYVLDSHWEVTATAMWVVESFVAGGMTYFFEAALFPAAGPMRAFRLTSAVLLLASLTMSLATVSLFGVLSIGRALAVTAVMFVTFRGGQGMGCVAGAALGAAMDLAQGGAPFFTMSYVLAALIAGVFSRDSRLVFVLSYVAASALSVLWFWSFHRWIPALFDTFAASVIFMLLPESLLARLSVFLPLENPGYGYLKAREYTRQRVDRCAAAFRGLYESLRVRTGGDSAESCAKLYDRAADTVCRSCPNAAKCWQEQYVDTLDVMNSLTPILTEKGLVETSDVPERFVQRCTRLPELLSAVNAESRAALSRRRFRAQLNESRSAALEQINCTSRILASLSRELGGEIQVDEEAEKSLRKYLRGLAIDASAAVYRLRGGRLRAEIKSQSLQLLKKDPKWLENLSSLLGLRLCSIESETDDQLLVLMEAEPYAVNLGVSSAKKSGETVSGDKYSCFRTDEGVLYVLLSDGMGSGPEAAKTASDTVSVTERFLRSGVSPAETLGVLSSLCLLKNEDSLESSTVDLLAVDMFSGQAALYKYGAPPAYLRHGAAVKRVGASALPVGFGAGLPKKAVTRLTLSPGDTLVMASDGVTAPDDRPLRKALAESDLEDMQALSRSILESSGSSPADDMTVIAVRMTERA